MSVDKEIRKADSERIIPVMQLLIGNRKVYEVERAARIGNGIIGKIMRGERFPSSLTIKKLTCPEAKPQNGVTYEKLMIAAGYMLPTGVRDFDVKGGATIEILSGPSESSKERLLAYQNRLYQIEVDNSVKRIAEKISETSSEELLEETILLMAYKEYAYLCCKGICLSEEDIVSIAERALENKNV